MNAKRKEQIYARELRRKGLSYTEIQKKIPVSQASLSLWLRDITLTKAQKERLIQLGDVGRIAGAKAKHAQRMRRMEELASEVQKEFPTLSKDPFFMLGLALYWAEGSKQKPWNTSVPACFCNTDHFTILIMREWFQRFGNKRKEDFTYRLAIHKTADVQKALHEWALLLDIDRNTVSIQIKNNTTTYLKNTNDAYKGLVSLRVAKSTWFNRRIALWAEHAATAFSTEKARHLV